MMRSIRSAVFALSLLALGCARETPPAGTPQAATPAPAPASTEAASVSPAQVQGMLGATPPPVLLDVRSPEEFAAGHIHGALHIPYEDVAQRKSEIPDSGTIVVFCAVGPRARAAEKSLVAAGVDPQRVLHMDGGMVAWEAAGLPVER
jgi:rhodanese-related sulfurtransferase